MPFDAVFKYLNDTPFTILWNQLPFQEIRALLKYWNWAERDLKLTRLSAIITPYLAKFIKYYKSNAAYLYEIFITFFDFIYQGPLLWLAHSIQGQSNES